MRDGELLVRLGVHEMHVGPVVVEVLHVLRLGMHAGELLAGAEGAVDDGARVERPKFRAHECATLARLHVLELEDPPDLAVELDMHAVLEAVGVDHVGHRYETSIRSLRSQVRFSIPSCVTTTSSSIRMPNLP